MEEFKGKRLFLYNLSTTGWVLLDSIWLTFAIAFLLPPKERVAEGMIPFVSNERFLGIITMLGAVMLFGRIVDAVADPLVASWTDRSTSRFGRRRFFLAIGGLPLALSTVLIFFPPLPHTSFVNGIYLAIIFGFYFFFFTIYVVPYLALIPELGHNEKARIGIATAQGYFSLIGSAVVMIGGPFLLTLFMQNADYVSSYRKMVIYLAIFGALLLYAAVFAVDEKRFSTAKPSQVPLMDSFKKTVGNKAFIIYLFANISLWFLFNIVRSSAIPIVITLMGADEAFAGNIFTILFVIAALCFPLVGYLARVRGKKMIMMLSLGLFSIFSIFLSFTGLAPLNPKIWGLIFIGLMGFPAAVLMIIPNVMLSELCDVDYKKTGERREAMYFGVQGFFMKLNLGLSTASLALLYSIFGKDISNSLGVRLAPVLGSIVALLGLIIMSRYPERQIKELLSK
ncbi:MAG TPA: MFS transporter [Candidatus Atribacteria bacterium]|nr:MFS transporter [Candidatus Atribacteria bacterium]